jgi:hypothetical protein
MTAISNFKAFKASSFLRNAPLQFQVKMCIRLTLIITRPKQLLVEPISLRRVG